MTMCLGLYVEGLKEAQERRENALQSDRHTLPGSTWTEERNDLPLGDCHLRLRHNGSVGGASDPGTFPSPTRDDLSTTHLGIRFIRL